ncbi:MerR family transcriptional regulator [Hyalangium sp.]|uniref:MerR family transcriptional regulator n=1 Tax=Hyalangium sp. TaxID=2028555 RepID=UPI002D543276|nr:MerR family transcriptional regulator [Hyalangium sp.]HYI03112.1 MerR family transcriptional regulator [Hyalangium sp.]
MPDRTYRIHIAAELSGVRAELIRAWERRYGFPHPQRTPSGYRVYTQQDVALLKRLKQLTEEGVAIREAVKMLPQLQQKGAETGEAQGTELSAPSLQFWREAVLAAAEDHAQARVSAVLDEVLSALPPLKAFNEVLAPVQREVGERWHTGQLTVVQEHLVSQVVRARVVSLLHAAPENEGARHAVLACFPEEQHEIGLLGVALRLRHAGLRVTLLGQRVPAADLGRMVTELRPDLVGLSAVTDLGVDAFADTLAQLLEALPRGVSVWAGGAAALAHHEVCERAGVHVFHSSDSWNALTR